MVDAQLGGTSQNYLWFFGSNTSSCGWSGLASLGTPQKPSANTWYNHSVGCTVLVQEPGHNFGMQHSSSLKCGTSSMLDDPNGCTASEYGDTFDPMGNGCRHMNAWQKSYQGWLAACNGVRVTNTGTFNLLPIEMSCNGTQFLQLKAPHPRPFMRPAAGGGSATTENLDYYYLELRTPVDFDGTLGGSSALSARVLVHMAADLQPRTGRGLHTFLLDMAPSTSSFSDAALPVGQTYTDPAGGLSFTVQSISNSGATIVVSYDSGSGDPTCMDGTAFTAPGPAIDSCSGTPTPTGAAGSTGSTGTGGRGGTGGSTGAGGRGGTTGGAGGRGGTTSAAGTSGAAGSPTSVGVGGATGGEGDVPPMDRGVAGGCACDSAGSASSAGLASVLLALCLAAAVLRPRKRAHARARRRAR
jgi:hypothetical protein